MLLEVLTNNPLDVKNAKHLRPLVEFYWGAATDAAANKAFYASFESDLVVNAGTGGEFRYVAAPELHVECDKQHGGVQDAPYTVQISKARSPMAYLLRPTAFPTVRVTVAECDPYDLVGTYRKVFQGRITMSTRDGTSLPGLCRLSVAGHKDLLASPLGIPCLSTCDHLFGDAGCRIDVEALGVTSTVGTVTGDVVTIPLTAGPYPPAMWDYGKVRCQGLSLTVLRTIVSGPGAQIQLIKPPPPEWAGTACKLFPGCNRIVTEDCRLKWNNERRFRGLGFAMLPYNPQLESP